MTGIAKGAQPRSPVDLPVIATVIGDPGGIGPEVCVKALALKDTPFAARHILIGSVDALRIAAATSGLEVSFRQVAAQPKQARTARRSRSSIPKLSRGRRGPSASRVQRPAGR